MYSVSHGGRSADFPVRSKLLPHNRAANRGQVRVRTTLRAGKSALRDLRPAFTDRIPQNLSSGCATV